MFNQISSLENLTLAFAKARKSKGLDPEVLSFEFDLEKNLCELHDQLRSGSYEHGGYRKFVVHDSKTREIKAAPFRDRVVHHAVCNLIEPIFDKSFIFDSWACRKGKGMHAAARRLRKFVQAEVDSLANRERERERE